MSEICLLADIGNSRIKWALATADSFLVGSPFLSAPEGLEARLDQHWQALTKPAVVVVSNVAGQQVLAILAGWVGQHWGSALKIAHSESTRGTVVNGYDNPAQLGVDRWVGLLGLARDHALPACLVDCGTAITFDSLDRSGQHQGGVIAPGLAMMKRALCQGTDALGMARDDVTAGLALGRDTVSGIKAGCDLACAGLIEKLMRMESNRSDEIRLLVLTGGDAARISRHLSIPHKLDEHVVLRGLLTMVEGDLL